MLRKQAHLVPDSQFTDFNLKVSVPCIVMYYQVTAPSSIRLRDKEKLLRELILALV